MSPTKLCPKCNGQFSPKRTNQKYCSDKCRKNGTRQDRSGEYRREAKRVAERIHDLTDAYVRNHIHETRHKFLADLIQAAIDGNRDVRRALFSQKALKDVGSYPSIGMEADWACRKAFGKRVAAFLCGYSVFDAEKLTSLNEYAPPPPEPAGWDYRTLLRGKANPPPAYIEPQEALSGMILEG